ncbi:hypothetical protein JT060_07095, partial [Helicobacter pylori]|nr:hypothetical protein [Helicobacter pylori]
DIWDFCLGGFKKFKLFFFFFDLILGIILIHLKGKAMKVTQGTINDFFALTNTVFSIPKIRKCIL